MIDHLMTVSEYMTVPVATVDEGAPLSDVERIVRDRRISCLPVLDRGGRAIGVISQTDLLRVGRREARGRGTVLQLPARTAGQVMHAGVVGVGPNDPLYAAARAMTEGRIHRVFVRDDGRIIGVLSATDLLRAVRDLRIDTPVASAMSWPARTILFSSPVESATDDLAVSGVHGLVVVDDHGWPIGIFSQREGLLAKGLPPETRVEDVMSHSLLSVHVKTPLHRAAAQAHATRARRVLAIDDRPPTHDGGDRVKGVLTGLDFAWAIARTANGVH